MPLHEVIRGPVYVLGDDVDTDQIIPAHYLMYNPSIPEERKQFGRYCMSSVPDGQAGLPQGNIPFVDKTDPAATTSRFKVIVAGKNFGCGSSREHAPLAIAEAGCYAVIAEFYARIFFRNSVNGGFLTPYESCARLVEKFRTGDDVEVRYNESVIINHTQSTRYPLQPLGDVAPIVAEGGVFAYARKVGMLK